MRKINRTNLPASNRRPRRDNRGFTIMETMLTIAIFSGILLLCMAIFIFIGRVYYKGLYENRAQAVVRDVVDVISEAIRTSGEDFIRLDCAIAGGFPSGTTYTASQLESPCPDVVADHPTAWAGYCIGNTGYVWQYNQQLDADDTEPVFVKISSCSDGQNAYDSRRNVRGQEGTAELLHKGMRLIKFDITCGVGNDPNLCVIDLKVAYGGDEKVGEEEFDADVFEFDMNGDSVLEDRADLLPTGATYEAEFKTERSLHIVKCKSNQSFCAIAELRTNALKRIK